MTNLLKRFNNFIIQTMNRLAFNPNQKIIQQWKQIYFTQPIMDSFETIIDRTHMYLEVIKNYKRKKQKQKKKLLRSRPSLCEDINEDPTVAEVQDISHEGYIKIIEEWIGGINILKAKLNEEAGKEQHNKKNTNDKHQQSKEQILSKNEVGSKLNTCQTHLQQITVQSIRFYNNFLSQQFIIIEDFILMKICQIRGKYDKMQKYLKSVDVKQINAITIRTIYQNIFIESEYIRKVVQQTKNTFKRHSSEKQYSSEYYQINQIREKYTSKVDVLEEQILHIKQDLRIVYFQYFKKKKSMKIRDHQKLQKIICDQIAVNKQEYEQTSSTATFTNGFIIAFLFCMLVAIIIFRQVNLSTLQSDTNYLSDFRIWRGASYLIYFNWIMGIVIYFLQKYRINYRMILLEEQTFIPKYQTFFFTASILSAIYLTLFLIYILYKLNIIIGHSAIQNMGYYMWLINLAFLLNPFKVLNYQGRKYFLILIYKNMMTLFRPMNMNIFFVAIIVGSFVQPFSDFAFTACKAVYSYQDKQRDCLVQTNNATFIFTLSFLFYRSVQSIRSHIQFADTCYSKPLIGITAVLSAANTVISSYFYNKTLSEQLLTYWLFSASISTIAGIQADLRADWGLISFHKEDWILRKYRLFPRSTYFIITAIDIVLNIGWILTISNNLSDNIGINPVYFLMILAYIELARKGLWIFFRIEEDHSVNIGNLQALIEDTHLYSQIITEEAKMDLTEEAIQIIIHERDSGYNKQFDDKGSSEIRQVKKLSDIQEMIVNKKINRVSLQSLIKQLQDYLHVIHQIYQQFEWEDQY